jgi:hypothetical protein
MFREEEFRPSTNGQQAMDLLREFNMSVMPYNIATEDHRWEATIYEQAIEYGPTLEIAICKAVIASRRND